VEIITMLKNESEAILKICLLAAFADGSKGEEEREQFKQIVDGLGGEVSPTLYQDVLFKKVKLEDAVRELSSDESKNMAYEMAVFICDADGVVNEKEKEFLNNLKSLLRVDEGTTDRIDKEGEQLAAVPVQQEEQILQDAEREAQINKMILNYSILNGALELLPQNLATMAIIPLQTKMVYRVGKQFGYELSTSHIKEFIATIGLGMTSQVLEGYARKLIGGFAKKFIGGIGKTVASTATGAAFSFGSTYAIGKVAYSYYSSGRTLDTTNLKSLFTRFKEDSKSLYTKYQGEIQNKARNINVNELIPMIRGNKNIV
jgi:uncharacterized protein (DUF697 family)/tellurite resistance protein